MENFEKCTVAKLGGPCSQHFMGNTSRQNQPQSAIIQIPDCSVPVISMGKYKKDITLLPMHWDYVFLALTYRFLVDLFVCFHILLPPWKARKKVIWKYILNQM